MVLCDAWIGMSESESESRSSSNSSCQSSYSSRSRSCHSDEKTERPPQKKKTQPNKGDAD